MIEAGIEPAQSTAGIAVRQDRQVVLGKELFPIPNQHDPIEVFLEHLQHSLEEWLACNLQKRLVPSHPAAFPADQNNTCNVMRAI
jgi:hypothetical protein